MTEPSGSNKESGKNQDPHQNHETRTLLQTPLRLLVRMLVWAAPERYKAKIRASGKRVTSHGFADAAVIIAMLHDISLAVTGVVALVALGLLCSFLED